MAPKVKSRPAPRFPDLEPVTELLRTPPATTERSANPDPRLGKRVEGYIRFMCSIGRLDGSSAEVKEEAVAIFYDRLVNMEQELGRIQEVFLLR